MNVFYGRVSSSGQHIDRQIAMAKNLEIEDEYIFIDKCSGKNRDREKLKEMMSFVRKGDTLIVESISRLARNTIDLLNIVNELTEKKVIFKSLKEDIDTSTPYGKFLLTIFGAMATLERESILERQREGIEQARLKNKYQGKPKSYIDKEKFEMVCKRWRAGEITAKKAMEIMKLKPNTFYRRVKEWRL